MWSLKLYGNESSETSPAAKSEEKRMFSQATSVSIRKNPLEPRGPTFLVENDRGAKREIGNFKICMFIKSARVTEPKGIWGTRVKSKWNYYVILR